MAQTTWITRHLQDAANAAYRAGLLPLFEDDDRCVYLLRKGDGYLVAELSPMGRVSLFTDEMLSVERDLYADYLGRDTVLAAIDAYGRTGSFRLGTPDGAQDEVFA